MDVFIFFSIIYIKLIITDGVSHVFQQLHPSICLYIIENSKVGMLCDCIQYASKSHTHFSVHYAWPKLEHVSTCNDLLSYEFIKANQSECLTNCHQHNYHKNVIFYVSDWFRNYLCLHFSLISETLTAEATVGSSERIGLMWHQENTTRWNPPPMLTFCCSMACQH